MPDGDTVGRTAAEKLPAHYVPSPVDPKAKVWRVELKWSVGLPVGVGGPAVAELGGPLVKEFHS